MRNKNRLRHNDITKVGYSVGEETCKTLPGLHAFSSCYSISAYGGRENQCSKAGYEGGRLRNAMVGVGKAWIKGEVGMAKVV